MVMCVCVVDDESMCDADGDKIEDTQDTQPPDTSQCMETEQDTKESEEVADKGEHAEAGGDTQPELTTPRDTEDTKEPLTNASVEESGHNSE